MCMSQRASVSGIQLSISEEMVGYMYRILIADDEFLVRLGLKTTIDWEAHGYQVVGEASNGQEALEMVDTLKPDIVLADIKMPFLDGL